MNNQILEHVLDENKEWVKSLSPKDIASILNSIAHIQHTTQTNTHAEYSDIPSLKGLAGENKFDHIVSQHMSNDYQLDNVAKRGRAGDFMITWKSPKTNRIYKIIIDVKNYSKTVPTSEVDKFYRDINLNTVDGGFLISLHSRIIGTNKIIELKEVPTDTNIIPVMFTQSNTPLVIVEVIKLLFHVIEIKDLNNNKVMHNDELVIHINQLNDNIQMITECRDVLQTSKTDIEKSLNSIMIKLMSCEYSLVSKINQINLTLTRTHMIEHAICRDEIKELDDHLHNENTLDTVKYIVQTFGSLVSAETEPLLYSIYDLGWTDSSIILPKKIWDLTKGEYKISIKFQKSGMCIIFPTILDGMLETIQEIKRLKKIRNSTDGSVIKIGPDTINHIIELYKYI